jgi:hypothetical protein
MAMASDGHRAVYWQTKSSFSWQPKDTREDHVVELGWCGVQLARGVGKLEHSIPLGMVCKAEGSLIHVAAFECAVKDTVVGEFEQPMIFFLVLLEKSSMHITHGIDELAISFILVGDPHSPLQLRPELFFISPNWLRICVPLATSPVHVP